MSRLTCCLTGLLLGVASSMATAGTPTSASSFVACSLGQFGFGTGTPTNAAPLPEIFPQGTDKSEWVQNFWQRHEMLSARLRERGAAAARLVRGGGEVGWLIDRAGVGFLHQVEGGAERFLAFRLAVGNRSSEPVVIKRASIEATIDGKPFPLKPLEGRWLQTGFMDGNSHVPLFSCTPPDEIRAAPGQMATAWLVFPGLPAETSLPTVQLKFPLGDANVVIDVVEHQRAVLDLSIERLGPRKVLALLTIGGEMNPFNLQSLVTEMDQLATQQVHRVVLQWKPTAPPVPDQLVDWIENTVANAGTDDFTSVFLPTATSDVKEIYVVQPPQQPIFSDSSFLQPGLAPRLHKHLGDAVAAALRTTYLTGSAAEFRAQIEQGHPLERAAALKYGSHRLPASDLPLLLRLTTDSDKTIRLAALSALREFSEPEALAALEAVLREGEPDDVQIALSALADSRFSAARRHLRQVIHTANPSLKLKLVVALAQVPRPAWADVLFECALDEQGRPRLELLKVLVALNHPQLPELLEKGLRSEDETLRDFVFPLVARRNDERSYRLALEYVTRYVANQPPQAEMIEFLERSGDRGVVPSLMSHLQRTGDRAELIRLLGRLGNREVADRLVAVFPRYEAHEQVAALEAIRVLQHPQYLDVVRQALGSSHSSVVQQAIQGLVNEGSPLAEKILCETMVASGKAEELDRVAMALVGLGTRAAREALKKAAQSSEARRRAAALNGLENLRQGSPANIYLEQAATFYRDRNWAQAMELYQVATQLDPDLPQGFAGLGDVAIKQEKWDVAATAFERALALAPDDGQIISGLAIAQVMVDKIDAAMQLMKAREAEFRKDPTFRYNTACVYARASERTRLKPLYPERDEQAMVYRKRALEELAQAVELGFKDFAWMQLDPDLKSVSAEADFLRLIPEGERKNP